MAKKTVCQLHEENIQLQLQAIHVSVQAIADMNDLNAAHQKEKLDLIYDQARKTNGRVTAQEEITEKLKTDMRIWIWLSEKPFRLVAAAGVFIAISGIFSKEVIQLLITLFK